MRVKMTSAIWIVGVVFAAVCICYTGVSAGDAAPIKIGAPDALTGAYASDGNVMLEATELAVADINAQGGLLGRKLEVVPFDVEDMLPEKLISAAEVLVMKEKCDVAVTGCNAMGPDVQAFGKYDVPYICNNASTVGTHMVRDEPEYWNVFQAGDNEPTYVSNTITNFLSLPYKFPNKKIALVHTEYDWDKKIIFSLREQAEKAGLEVVVFEEVPSTTVDYNPILSKIRAHQPAMIFLSVYSPESIAAFLNQYLQNPTNSLVDLGYAVSIPSFMEIAGKSAAGISGYAALGRPAERTERGRDLEARYEKMFGKPMPISVVLSCYDGLMAWAEAVRKVGKVDDYKAVAKALKENLYDGIGGVYDFNNPLQAARAGDDLLPTNLYQAEGDRLVLRAVGSEMVSAYQLPPWLPEPWEKM